MAEHIRRVEHRRFPVWHPEKGDEFAPAFYVMRGPGTADLIEQLKEAPLEESAPGPYHGTFPGEAVAGKWESAHGHAHASLRYGLMSRPSPSVEPPAANQHLIPPDPPEELRREALRREVDRRENPTKSFNRSEFIY